MIKKIITEHTYTHLFCEENIWKLVQLFLRNQVAKPIDVLFVINKTESIALYAQSKDKPEQPVIWDYHVILLAELNNKPVIYDFDSVLNFPTPFDDYFNATFPPEIDLSTQYRPLLKAIRAEYYLQHFYSDRQHMRGIIEETYFPNYDIIKPNEKITPLTLAQCRAIDYMIETRVCCYPSEIRSQYVLG